MILGQFNVSTISCHFSQKSGFSFLQYGEAMLVCTSFGTCIITQYIFPPPNTAWCYIPIVWTASMRWHCTSIVWNMAARWCLQNCSLADSWMCTQRISLVVFSICKHKLDEVTGVSRANAYLHFHVHFTFYATGSSVKCEMSMGMCLLHCSH